MRDIKQSNPLNHIDNSYLLRSHFEFSKSVNAKPKSLFTGLKKLTAILVLDLVEVPITFRHSPFRATPFRDARGVGGSSYSQWHTKEEVRANVQLELKLQVKLSRQEDFPNFLPLMKDLFGSKQIPNVPLAGSLKHFVMNWQKINSDQIILGHVTIIVTNTFSELPHHPCKNDGAEQVTVLKEIF